MVGIRTHLDVAGCNARWKKASLRSNLHPHSHLPCANRASTVRTPSILKVGALVHAFSLRRSVINLTLPDGLGTPNTGVQVVVWLTVTGSKTLATPMDLRRSNSMSTCPRVLFDDGPGIPWAP